MEVKKSKKKKYIILAIVLVVLVALYMWVSSSAKKAMSTILETYVVENNVELGNVEIKITGNGVIEPLKRYEIVPSMTGEVTVSNYNEGDEVKKDATIYKIGGINVKTPSTGTLITKNVEKGDYVTQLQTATGANVVAIVADISKMKVNLEVDELDIRKIEIGMKATITCDAVEAKEYEAEVTKIASEGKNINGVTTYDVTLEISNPEGLKIGMNADITMIVENKQNILKIPMDSINKENGKTYVYIKDESYVGDRNKTKTSSLAVPSSMEEVEGYKKQYVEVGINNKDHIEITSGLSENEKVYSIQTSKSLIEYMVNSGGSGMSSMGGM